MRTDLPANLSPRQAAERVIKDPTCRNRTWFNHIARDAAAAAAVLIAVPDCRDEVLIQAVSSQPSESGRVAVHRPDLRNHLKRWENHRSFHSACIEEIARSRELTPPSLDFLRERMSDADVAAILRARPDSRRSPEKEMRRRWGIAQRYPTLFPTA